MTTVHERVGRALGIDYLHIRDELTRGDQLLRRGRRRVVHRRLAFGAAAQFTLSTSARE